MKCPVCDRQLILKTQQPYKESWLCSNKYCIIVSVILTTTIKDATIGYEASNKNKPS